MVGRAQIAVIYDLGTTIVMSDLIQKKSIVQVQIHTVIREQKQSFIYFLNIIAIPI